MLKTPCVRQLIRELEQSIPKDATVLDLGCGVGDYTYLIAQKAKKVIATDVQDVYQDQYRAPNIEFKIADAIKIPFADGQFDVVVALDLIEHIEDDQKFVDEAWRVLRPGGILFLETPNLNRLSVFGRKRKFPLVLGRDHLGECVHIREYSKKMLEKLFAQCQLKSLKIKSPWLGLRLGRVEIGITKFPNILEKYGQYWIVKAVNP